MNKFAIFLIITAFFLFSCNRNEEAPPGTLDSDTSYAFGMFIAAQVGLTDMRFDYQALIDGFREFNEGEELRFPMEEALDFILPALMRLQAEIDERMWLEGQRNRDEGEAYLAQNRQRSGVNVTESGLQYEVISQGSGARPGPADTVLVYYAGSFIDGTIFDSTSMRGVPFEVVLNSQDPAEMVIDGWTEGIQLMNEGSTFRFVIPPDLAYGPGGGPIPPDSTLIFEIELVSIVR